ncbi:MAG: IS200/IS605 family accessory protein TnpB-related protein [Methanosphaera sp.]|nr:IS200/IS605 family accessory protein TnpB-related protein [Methanosphaera sp.]
MDGRFLKNQIAFRCKKIAHYQSILDQQGLKKSKRIDNINNCFKGIQNNFLNHTVKFIIDTCKEQDIGTIILGYNNNFQYKSNMGKKQNQIFSQIAFKQFKEKLEYTNTKIRHNTNNTRRILHKQKQFPRQRHTTNI